MLWESCHAIWSWIKVYGCIHGITYNHTLYMAAVSDQLAMTQSKWQPLEASDCLNVFLWINKKKKVASLYSIARTVKPPMSWSTPYPCCGAIRLFIFINIGISIYSCNTTWTFFFSWSVISNQVEYQLDMFRSSLLPYIEFPWSQSSPTVVFYPILQLDTFQTPTWC